MYSYDSELSFLHTHVLQCVPLATEPDISLIILPLMRILQRLQTHTTDTFLFISHTTNVLLFKFRCNIFIGVRIIKEMPGWVASGTPCIYRGIVVAVFIVYELLGAFAKLRGKKKRLLALSCMSVRPYVCLSTVRLSLHATTRLPLDEFSWNLMFEDSSKMLLIFYWNLTNIKGPFTWKLMYNDNISLTSS